VRLHEDAAGGDAADKARELQRSRDDGALANGNGDSLAGVPLPVKYALHPIFAGHQAGFFGGQVNAGLAAEAELGGVVGNAIDTMPDTKVVEENVAGLIDGPVYVHHTVRTLAKDPAFELAAVERAITRAKHAEAFRDSLCLIHCRSQDNFENRSGIQLRLNRPIQQGTLRVVIDLRPLFCTDEG